MSGYLTFGELKESECFISVPVEGDDKGHGGLKGAHFIFMKIKTTGKDNAIRRKDEGE